MDKRTGNDNLAGMNTPDKHETEAAWELCIQALQAIRQYTSDPGDIDAATIAVLCRAIELTAKKEVEICYKRSSSTSTN